MMSGMSAPNDGVPVPRNMSKNPSSSRSPKLAPMLGTTRASPAARLTSVNVPSWLL